MAPTTDLRKWLDHRVGLASPWYLHQADLVRSARDDQVIGLISEVTDRYGSCRNTPPLEIWKFNRKVRSIPAGGTLRIQATCPFRLHWTGDEWRLAQDTSSTPIGTGHEHVDIRVPPEQRAPVRFTFFWTTAGRWEGRDFQAGVDIRPVAERGGA